MAKNVFGTPVTDETVKSHFPDKEVITRKDKAYFAYNLMQADKKKEQAEQYVLQLKEKYGDRIATLCTIYNATGDTLQLYKSHDYHGHIGEAPYPTTIENGQWAAFLHVDNNPRTLTESSTGSSAAVVYLGHNNKGDKGAWLNSWSSPYEGKNYVYIEVRDPTHYNEAKVWDWVYDLIKKESSENTWNGCYSTGSIGQNTPFKYSAIMTLECIP